MILPEDFKIIGNDGTRENNSVGQDRSRLNDGENLPSEIGIEEKVTRKIILDSQYESELIVLSVGIVG